MPAASRPHLTRRFADALTFACELHRSQTRKGTDTPYVGHLLGVTDLALEHGADEDESIAAVLHDAVEDQGGEETAARILERFGARVAEIVEACSDTDVMPKPPWKERKEAYIAHLDGASGSARLVSACDKLHNARAILGDFRDLGEELWARFNGGREGTLWYYRELVTAFRKSPPGPRGARLVDELDRVVSEIERLAANPETLLAIQHHFHGLIRERAAPALEDASVTHPEFPTLRPADLDGEKRWFAVEGMYGGFSYWFASGGREPELIVESWSRVVAGSEQRHEITATGCILVSQGDGADSIAFLDDEAIDPRQRILDEECVRLRRRGIEPLELDSHGDLTDGHSVRARAKDDPEEFRAQARAKVRLRATIGDPWIEDDAIRQDDQEIEHKAIVGVLKELICKGVNEVPVVLACGPYFIQFVLDQGVLCCEAVCNKYLKGETRLDDNQMSTLGELGWEPPKSERENWGRTFETRSDDACDEIAKLFRRTFMEVYRVDADAPITIDASWEDGLR